MSKKKDFSQNMKNLKYSKKEKRLIHNYLIQELTPPEKKYHTNKEKASKDIINYLHKILAKIAPMSKHLLKYPSVNNKLINSILAIFQSDSAKYLFAVAPYNSVGSVDYYLQPYISDYTDFAKIEKISYLANNNVFTKHSKYEFKYLKQHNYKYAHAYDKLTGTKFRDSNGHTGRKNIHIVTTQCNIPTKRDLMKLIRSIMYDSSMFHIKTVDYNNIQDTIKADKYSYQRGLKQMKSAKKNLHKDKSNLSQLRQYFSHHQQPKYLKHLGC